MSTPVPITVASLKVEALSIFEGLMETSTGDKSIYKDAMDKIDLISTNEKFSESERAKMIAELAASIVGSITNQAMQVAFQLAKEDRDATYAYPKVTAEISHLDAQSNKIDTEDELIEANKEKIATDNLMTQAKIRREYGGGLNSWKNVAVTMPTLTMSNTGNKFAEIAAVNAQAYGQYAKSYREAGKMVIAVPSSGGINPTISGAVLPTDPASSVSAGLIANQSRTQYRTYLGFEDNKQQHAANASANMVATMFTSDSSAKATTDALATWNTSMTYLQTTTP